MIECTRGGTDLRVPPDAPQDEVWRYGIGVPVQVGPHTAAVFCNIRRDYAPTWDFETGTDAILFDDLSNINVQNAVPISRNNHEVNPETGKWQLMIKFPVIGGFVPHGALRADGSPHPFAGTGFGISQSIGYDPTAEKISGPAHMELRQLTYDGTEFRVLETEQIADEFRPGLTTAIPDGDDLLYAVSRKGSGSGVARWTHGAGGWRQMSYSPADGADRSSEPSLIRDTDGALLFCSRGVYDLGVWRSEDGEHWQQVVDVKRLLAQSPVTLNQAADGTPYVAGNPHQEWFEDTMGVYSHGREFLSLWPLNADRTGLGPGVVARACRVEFGPPPGNTYWLADHPSAATVRLADGQWHSVLAYRMMELSENALCWCFNGVGPPPDRTGCCLEEVTSDGEAWPAWHF